MSGPSVLAIGLDPRHADLSAFPEITPELVASYIDQQIERVRSLGYDVDTCLVDQGETAEQLVTEALETRPYDCVVIGAGLREPGELLLLFECILNLVHHLAPGAHIAFNTSPADTAEAVQRWIDVPRRTAANR
ncbi:MAG TPA: hypothetical protein VHE36_10970 [Sphingomicrobium sp.]|nr:hypothetical protein [Sphingomicrobium sp.]